MPLRVAGVVLGFVLAVLVSVDAPARGAPPEAPSGPAPAEVRRALDRGADWLRRAYAGGFPESSWHDPVELVVLTLHHAGADRSDAVLRAGLERLASEAPRYTYRASVLAMALAEVNPRLYLPQIARAAQWLVDTQLPGGDWGYPGVMSGPDRQPVPVTVTPPTLPGSAEGPPPEKVVIERRASPEGMPGAKGDFSNTQFAILGLRACRDAGVEIPAETWRSALAYLAKRQRKGGGWGYDQGDQPDRTAYASLTAAGLSSAAICVNALGKRPDDDPVVRRAERWMDQHEEVGKNVAIDQSSVIGPSSWQYYHLYSVERVGAVLRLDRIGGEDWYAAGARRVLAEQGADGSWKDPSPDEMGPRPRYLDVADTCFAMLFLARRTPPLTR